MKPTHSLSQPAISRRAALTSIAGLGAFSLPQVLQLQSAAGSTKPRGKAKSCILIFCWGGMSHFESWDPKPDAPVEIRGLFSPMQTKTPGIFLSEHMLRLADHTDKLAIIRSISHDDSAHGRGIPAFHQAG